MRAHVVNDRAARPHASSRADCPEWPGSSWRPRFWTTSTGSLIIFRSSRPTTFHSVSWVADALSAPVPRGTYEIDWKEPDFARHQDGVAAALAAIGAGEVYQACVCTQFTGTLRGSSLEFFADAVTRTMPARAAYLAGDWGAVASLSPELFIRRVGDHVTSSPIKGTLPLHRPPADLLASAKDVAENIMIVDLARNDLGQVADTGTVTVPELLTVRAAPGVWHLVSTVAATVRPEVSNAALLAATFPPASVTEHRKDVLVNYFRIGSRCGAGCIAAPSGWRRRSPAPS